MPAKSDRVEARLSPEERERINRAAEFEGQSVSSFMVTAAVEKANQVISEHAVTRVPADYSDQILQALDEPGPAPQLRRAGRRARQRSRIR
jgi:uncharacterized protein (DUF1778 family)